MRLVTDAPMAWASSNKFFKCLRLRSEGGTDYGWSSFPIDAFQKNDGVDIVNPQAGGDYAYAALVHEVRTSHRI